MRKGLRSLLLVAIAAGWLLTIAEAADLKITLPKHSKLTPVQQLNRDGVKAIQKHQVAKAKRLFYRAYLLDPDDPFTLNNLGYISELEGDADRALKYYELSSKNASQAKIDIASRRELKGRPLQDAFAALQVPELKANKANVQAISLMGKGRYTEAEVVLKKALELDSRNPFTLNNMGYVTEAEGDLQAALRYYSSAASMQSEEKILVAPNPKWRGRTISEVASQNARAVNEAISRGEDLNAQVARLNVRGVAALNHNDPKAAREFFLKAYKLDPNNAFSLNNMGYVAELEGDRETATTYYEDARKAADANAKVTYATRREAEGLPIGEVGEQNLADTDSVIDALRTQRQRQGGGPIRLKRRDNSVVVEPERPAPPLPEAASPPALPQPALPERSERPPSSQPGNQPVQPAKRQQPEQNSSPQHIPPAQDTPQNPDQGGLLPPLPESQQPPAVRTPGTNQAPAPAGQAPQTQPQSKVLPENRDEGGLLLPLPESQQPPTARTPTQQSQSAPPQ